MINNEKGKESFSQFWKFATIHLFLTGFTAAVILLSLNALWGAQRVYKNDIVEKNRNLASLQDQIKNKKNEKAKYLVDEKKISAELDSIAAELAKIQRQREKLRKEIVKAERNLQFSKKEMDISRLEKNKWNGILNSEIDSWHRDTLSYNKYFDDGIDEKLRFEALGQKKQYFSNAQLREKNWQTALYKWQNAQKHLNELKLEQEANAREKSAVLGQKKQLLQTTVGRRIASEKEIKELTDSAKALSALIERLERERERQLEREREAQARRHKIKAKKVKKRIEPKRRNLTWPVRGKVVSRFGKNKHPDLDTYVISNGIKIQTKTGSEVKAASAGEVVFIGEFRSYGLMLIIDGGGGLYTIYGHLGAINVSENAKVIQGEILGQITSSENPVLYFEVRYNGQPDDPLLWLNSR